MFSFAFQPDPELLVQNQVTKRLYLVSIIGKMDDVPVVIFADEASAKKFVADNPPYPSYEVDLNSEVINKAFEAFPADVGLVLGMRVTEFADGVPVATAEFFWEGDADNPSPWTPHEDWYIDESKDDYVGDGCIHAKSHNC